MNEEIDLVNIERIDMKVIITDCDHDSIDIEKKYLKMQEWKLN